MATSSYRHPEPNLHALTLAIISSFIAPFAAYAALAGFFYIFPPLLFFSGLYLLIHYWKASSSHPTSRRHRGFWIISATFNGLLAIPSISLVAMVIYAGDDTPALLVFSAFVLWQFTALILSLAAEKHESANLPPPDL
jgi:hypothetical protein